MSESNHNILGMGEAEAWPTNEMFYHDQHRGILAY